MSRRPAIVAELGRPETAEEEATRKAEAARERRSSQTVRNLIGALLATLAVVAAVVLIVPQPAGTPPRDVDFHKIAAQAQGTEPAALVAPDVPADWTSNAARVRTDTADGVDTWYIGLLTPDSEYVGLVQGFRANDSWVADRTDHTRATGALTIDGVTWTVYDNRDADRDADTVRYALTRTAGPSTFVVFGTASTADIRTVARAVDREVQNGDAS